MDLNKIFMHIIKKRRKIIIMESYLLFFQLLGLPNLPNDPLYLTNPVRVKNRTLLIETLQEKFQQKSTADWLKAFEGSGIPYGPINNIQQVFSDPQVSINTVDPA